MTIRSKIRNSTGMGLYALRRFAEARDVFLFEFPLEHPKDRVAYLAFVQCLFFDDPQAMAEELRERMHRLEPTTDFERVFLQAHIDAAFGNREGAVEGFALAKGLKSRSEMTDRLFVPTVKDCEALKE
ncbi:hypothetical protein WJT74_01510 [Sphingomicrobium sp. XHP0239]|uniref:hypothetical protein n=1 Tax=Sphingomicrobium maritimum TaxID=3133972 RepID=UPI0031CCCB0A